MAMYAPDGRMLSPGEVYEGGNEPAKEDEVWTENLNVTLMCPDCRENPPNLVEEYASGDVVCGSCGRVLAEHTIDTRSEWRTFSNDDQGNDDPSRIGDAANPLLNGSQLQTEIGFGDGGLRVRELSRAQNKSNMDKSNKSLQSVYGQISALCESTNLQKPVSDTAKLYYKQASEAKEFKGKSTDAMIAGCVFIACRQLGVNRSFREINKTTRVSKKEIGRIFKLLDAYFKKKVPSIGNIGPALNNNPYELNHSTDAAILIGRACDKLNLSRQTQLVAEEVARAVSELGVAAGRSPLSITGACIYLVSHLMGEPKTPKDIGVAVDVSDGTIRTAYKLIYTAREQIVTEAHIKRGADLSRVPAA
jgi:transcription initiation factor TFIIB